MIKPGLIILLEFILILPLSAQFTYFNLVTGQQGDMNSESGTNVEVVDDGYVVWGSGVDEQGLLCFIRKYNFDGTVYEENIIYDEEEYFYAGIVNSMQWNSYTNQFVVLQGSDLGADVEGRFLTFDEGFNQIDNLFYDDYAPYTYFFGFYIAEDGYVVFGEQGGMMNSVGTFIMKLDFEGNVIWDEILQPEVYQHIYRNNSIVKFDDGYLIGGYGLIESEPFGLLTKVNESGETVSEITVMDNDALRSAGMGVLRLENGEILVTQLFSYADVAELENPNVYWNNIRLYTFDPETEELEWLQDHFDNYEMMGGPYDLVATSDGGAVILGGSMGLDIGYYAWMMKIDSLGNEEWFQEYTYEDCGFDCMNILYDIELAPDGGYIAVGEFTNWAVDPRNMSWLLKVDACGDVEWQDCQLTGIKDRAQTHQFSIYPNPGNGAFFLNGPDNVFVSSYQLLDMAGREISNGTLSAQKRQSIHLEDIPTGLYLLKMRLSNGKVETQRLQVLK